MPLNALTFCLEAPLVHGGRDAHMRHKVFSRDDAGGIWLPASTVRGALRHHLGVEEGAMSGACALLMPMRALDAPSVWVTSTTTLTALARVLPQGDALPPLAPAPGCALTSFEGHMHEAVMIEERVFERVGAISDAWLDALTALLPHAHEGMRARVRSRLVVLHPHDHAWLVRHTTPLVTRTSLHDRKRLATHWHEERLPRDTVLLATLDGARPETLRAGDALIRMGGGESLGMGWASVAAHEARAALETPELSGRPTAFATTLPAPFDTISRVPGAVFDVRVSALALQLHTELRASGLGATLIRLLRGTSGAHGQLRMLLTGMAGEASLTRLSAMTQDEYIALHDQLDAALASIAMNRLLG